MANSNSMNPVLAQAILDSAGRLGIDPVDLGTAISYETAGTLDPWKRGPTTQWGEHRGLIQWGEPQRAKYGVTADTSVPDQMRAVEKYLTDAGVKPGHGLMDVYSAINAGRVGLYNRSDANNGGAPGTVADKVNNQMAGHRARAQSLLGGAGMLSPVASTPTQSASAVPAASPVAAPVAPAASPAEDESGLMTSLQGIQQMLAAQGDQTAPVQLDFSPTPNMLRARQLALAMQKQEPLG